MLELIPGPIEEIRLDWAARPAAQEPSRWYALYSRPRFEKRVAADLIAKRVETYLPLIRDLHQWKDRKKTVDLPAFPGYVFARFADCPMSRVGVLRTVGVVRILGQGPSIEPIPDFEIESVQQLLRANVLCFVHPFLREGAWVRVKRGSLKGLEGLFVRAKNQTRLVLSITLLSQSVATEIDATDVEVVRPDGAASWPTGPRLQSTRGAEQRCIRI